MFSNFNIKKLKLLRKSFPLFNMFFFEYMKFYDIVKITIFKKRGGRLY